jgi:cobalamin biosynthesis Mg chelatase CobN
VSGETQENVSGLTIDTLKLLLQTEIKSVVELVNQRFNLSDKAVQTAMTAAEKAVNAALAAAEAARTAASAATALATTKQEATQTAHNVITNQYREQLTAQATTFPTREEVNQRFIAQEQRLDKLEKAQSQAAGSTSRGLESKTTTMWVIGLVVVAAIAIAAIILKR